MKKANKIPFCSNPLSLFAHVVRYQQAQELLSRVTHAQIQQQNPYET